MLAPPARTSSPHLPPPSPHHVEHLHLLCLQRPARALLVVERPEDGRGGKDDKDAVERLEVGHKLVAVGLARGIEPVVAWLTAVFELQGSGGGGYRSTECK